jgi:hypothetical protein
VARPAYSAQFIDVQGWSSTVSYLIPPFLTLVIREISTYSRGHAGDELRVQDYATGGTFYYHKHASTLSTNVLQVEDRRWVRVWNEDTTHGFTVTFEGEADWDVYISGYLLSTSGA